MDKTIFLYQWGSIIKPRVCIWVNKDEGANQNDDMTRWPKSNRCTELKPFILFVSFPHYRDNRRKKLSMSQVDKAERKRV